MKEEREEKKESIILENFLPTQFSPPAVVKTLA
jgi:hypothetical protein